MGWYEDREKERKKEERRLATESKKAQLERERIFREESKMAAKEQRAIQEGRKMVNYGAISSNADGGTRASIMQDRLAAKLDRQGQNGRTALDSNETIDTQSAYTGDCSRTDGITTYRRADAKNTGSQERSAAKPNGRKRILR